MITGSIIIALLSGIAGAYVGAIAGIYARKIVKIRKVQIEEIAPGTYLEHEEDDNVAEYIDRRIPDEEEDVTDNCKKGCKLYSMCHKNDVMSLYEIVITIGGDMPNCVIEEYAFTLEEAICIVNKHIEQAIDNGDIVSAYVDMDATLARLEKGFTVVDEE